MDNVLGSQWIVPLDGKREEMGAGMHMNRWDLWYQKKNTIEERRSHAAT